MVDPSQLRASGTLCSIPIIMIMTIEKNIALTTILRGDKGVAAASSLKKFRMNAKNANAS